MHITFDDLRRLCPRGDAAILAEIVRLAPELLPRYGIDTPQRWCHWIAQVAAETGGLRQLEEGLSYTGPRLMQVWPARFPTLALAEPYAGNPQKLAEKVYGGRTDLGNNQPATAGGSAGAASNS